MSHKRFFFQELISYIDVNPQNLVHIALLGIAIIWKLIDKATKQLILNPSTISIEFQIKNLSRN